MNKPVHIHWFRQDLRLTDNPALSQAANDAELICIYIDEDNEPLPRGGASRWWLQQSLQQLNKELDGKLQCFKGNASNILTALAVQSSAKKITWSKRYTPQHIQHDNEIIEQLEHHGIAVESFNGSLLAEPHTVLKPDGLPYKIFTAFNKRAMANMFVPLPIAAPNMQMSDFKANNALNVDTAIVSKKEQWHKQLLEQCHPGEQAAKSALALFLQQQINNYHPDRDFPNKMATSGMSAHLHFGEISPRQIWHASVQSAGFETSFPFLRQVMWREFSFYQLYHFPDLATSPLKPIFKYYPWHHNEAYLTAWQQGLTGIPIIDAGMRELWQTGIMHNRVRMLCASFLCKNLQINWQDGAAWFWDCLVDADIANNSAGWQWVAGSGADSSPYFRIFNPETQSRKFDANAEYIRRFCPELSALNNKEIHAPWLCSAQRLKEANISLGKNYPKPLVDLKVSRQQALSAYHQLKQIKDDVLAAEQD